MKKEERISVAVPRGYATEEPNLLVSVNGVNYLLPRGKTSSVPPEVAWELERANRAQQRLDARIDSLSKGETL